MIIDEQSRTLSFVNERARRILRPIGAALRIGMDVSTLCAQMRDMAGRPFLSPECPLWRALEGELIDQLELEVCGPDGARRILDLTAAPMHDGEGVVIAAVAAFQDVTAQRSAELEVRRARDDLEVRVRERTAELSRTLSALQLEAVERIRLVDALQQEREHLEALLRSRRELLRRLVRVQEEERRRIARELHDQLGQDLSAIALNISALCATPGLPADVLSRLDDLRRMVEQVDRDVDGLALELRPPLLGRMDLQSALRHHLESWSEHAGVPVDLLCVGLEQGELPEVLEATIYRIIQEAATNVLKHARATQLSVVLERRADCLITTIEDNGVGFEVQAQRAGGDRPQRLGLVGIEERVLLFDGTLVIDSAPGRGTSLVVRIPLSSASSRSTGRAAREGRGP